MNALGRLERYVVGRTLAGVGAALAVIAAVILLVQSVPYLAAVSMAAVAALPSPARAQGVPGAVAATSTAGHAVARAAAE